MKALFLSPSTTKKKKNACSSFTYLIRHEVNNTLKNKNLNMFLIHVDDFQLKFGYFFNCTLYLPENTNFQT
jgi:hypothetical protein